MTSTLDRQRHQILYLSDPSRDAASQSLARAFAAAAVPFSAGGLLAPGVLQGIELDLLYASLRHRAFLHAPLLAVVMSDYLARRYYLEHAVVSSLTSAVLAAARLELALPRDAVVPEGDDEFLSYVCVAAATAADAAALELDLGIGTALLGRIKEALGLLAAAEEQAASTNSSRFIPELEARIASAVGALAEAMRATPWELQLRRLKYLLLDLEEPWLGTLAAHGVSWVFQLLLTLATREVLHTREISKRLGEILPPGAAPAGEVPVVLLCQSLAARGLIARDGSRSWRALPLACELTARAFAASLPLGGEGLLPALPTMAAAFQAVALQQVEGTAAFFTDVLLRVRPLSPLGFSAACDRLASMIPTAEMRAVLQACLAHEPSFCLRHAAAEAAAKLAIPIAQENAAVADCRHERRPFQPRERSSPLGA